MHPSLRAFIFQYLDVVAATLLPVILITLLSIPLNSGDHPGQIRGADATADRHLT